MRVETDWDRITFETESKDAEILSHVKRTAESVRDLAEAAGFVGQDGPCQNCGKDARLRPLGVQHEDGSYGAQHVCAECQGGMVEHKLRQAAEREQMEGDGEAEDAG